MSCKQNVYGLKCEKCKAGYYGLSANNPLGCSPCNCSKSFSYSNLCDQNGQCSCKPHMVGKQCDQIEENYFCPNLDYQTFEAEHAEQLNENSKISERLELIKDDLKSWTGNGFMRVFDNSHLKFNLKKLLSNGTYDILMRFESLNFSFHNISVRIINKGLDYNTYPNASQTNNCLNFKSQYLVEDNYIFLDKSLFHSKNVNI